MPSKNIELLISNQITPISNIIDWEDYRIGYFIAPSKSNPSNNEDSLLIISNDDKLAFGVSDGAGGHPKGKEASLIASQNMFEYFKIIHKSNHHIVDQIEKINDEVLDLKVGAHCTLTMGMLTNEHFRSYSVGDSEIIYWNGHGNEIYSNIPQSAIGYQIEAGIVEQEESLDDPDRYMVDNMIGDLGIRIEATSKISTKKGHTILVGSDGLFDNIPHEQLGELVGKGQFEKSFEELISICLNQKEIEWKKDDDISFILIRKIKA